MELISIGKFAKMLGVTPTTLRRMHARGDLIPYRISKGGTRYYSISQIKDVSKNSSEDRITVGYCRVSATSQKNDLATQVQNVKSYMIAKGYQFEIITDIGSGINYQKKGLQQLIDKIVNQEIHRIVVLYKDRLIRFGFELIEYLCSLYDVKIEIIDNTEHSEEEELTEDLVQIITVFANRLYGQRSKKTKQLLQAVKHNVDTVS